MMDLLAILLAALSVGIEAAVEAHVRLAEARAKERPGRKIRHDR